MDHLAALPSTPTPVWHCPECCAVYPLLPHRLEAAPLCRMCHFEGKAVTLKLSRQDAAGEPKEG